MDSQPDDIETLRAELALARAKAADDAATIARQNLEIAKLKRQIYGPRSERTARLLDQMELELEELEAAATEDEIAAERAAAKTTNGCRRSRASARPASRSPSICRASASSFRRRPPATAAAARACASSARPSPRRWR